MAKKLKILYRKNLKMSEGKIAAQAVHAALGLAAICNETKDRSAVVVLGVSNKKFDEAKTGKEWLSVVKDAGFTEVEPGTETALAFMEED